MATDCNELKNRIANVVEALKANPDDRANQMLLNQLAQIMEDECAARNVIQAPISPICSAYSTLDAAFFNQAGRSNDQRRDEVAYCNQAMSESPFKQIKFTDLNAILIDFRKTFAQVLPYPTPYRSLGEIADLVRSTTSSSQILSLANMLKRATLISFPFTSSVDILRVLLGVYYKSVLNSNQAMISELFKMCGQGLESITLLNGTTISWKDVLVPQVRLNFFFPSILEPNVYETKIKPFASAIITDIRNSPVFALSSISQENLNAFTTQIGSKFKIPFSARTLSEPPISATYTPSSSLGWNPKLAQINVQQRTIKEQVTPPKVLNTNFDTSSSFAQTPTNQEPPKTETAIEATPIPKTPWYKTPFGVIGICVSVVGVGGAVYVFTKKK
jgi:hypothetical protein